MEARKKTLTTRQRLERDEAARRYAEAEAAYLAEQEAEREAARRAAVLQAARALTSAARNAQEDAASEAIEAARAAKGDGDDGVLRAVRIRDSNGATPLALACTSGSAALVRLLLSLDKPPWPTALEPDRSGRLPIHAAALHGHVDCLEALLSHESREVVQAQLAKRDVDGLTALHEAAAMGDVAACRVLLLHGADGARVDKFGKTPSDHARSEGHELVSKLVAESVVVLSGAGTPTLVRVHEASVMQKVWEKVEKITAVGESEAGFAARRAAMREEWLGSAAARHSTYATYIWPDGSERQAWRGASAAGTTLSDAGAAAQVDAREAVMARDTGSTRDPRSDEKGRPSGGVVVSEAEAVD